MIDAIREREDDIATLQAEIDALQTTLEILHTVDDPDAMFDLDAILSGHEWPVGMIDERGFQRFRGELQTPTVSLRTA